jgi:hypothetical protein
MTGAACADSNGFGQSARMLLMVAIVQLFADFSLTLSRPMLRWALGRGVDHLITAGWPARDPCAGWCRGRQ